MGVVLNACGSSLYLFLIGTVNMDLCENCGGVGRIMWLKVLAVLVRSQHIIFFSVDIQ